MGVLHGARGTNESSIMDDLHDVGKGAGTEVGGTDCTEGRSAASDQMSIKRIVSHFRAKN